MLAALDPGSLGDHLWAVTAQESIATTQKFVSSSPLPAYTNKPLSPQVKIA